MCAIVLPPFSFNSSVNNVSVGLAGRGSECWIMWCTLRPFGAVSQASSGNWCHFCLWWIVECEWASCRINFTWGMAGILICARIILHIRFNPYEHGKQELALTCALTFGVGVLYCQRERPQTMITWDYEILQRCSDIYFSVKTIGNWIECSGDDRDDLMTLLYCRTPRQPWFAWGIRDMKIMCHCVLWTLQTYCIAGL